MSVLYAVRGSLVPRGHIRTRAVQNLIPSRLVICHLEATGSERDGIKTSKIVSLCATPLKTQTVPSFKKLEWGKVEVILVLNQVPRNKAVCIA